MPSGLHFTNCHNSPFPDYNNEDYSEHPENINEPAWFPDIPPKFSGIKLKPKLGTKLLPVVEPEYNPEDATTAATANAGLSLDLPPAPDPITTGPPTNVNEGDVDQPSQNYDCVKIEEMEENKGGN